MMIASTLISMQAGTVSRVANVGFLATGVQAFHGQREHGGMMMMGQWGRGERVLTSVMRRGRPVPAVRRGQRRRHRGRRRQSTPEGRRPLPDGLEIVRWRRQERRERGRIHEILRPRRRRGQTTATKHYRRTRRLRSQK